MILAGVWMLCCWYFFDKLFDAAEAEDLAMASAATLLGFASVGECILHLCKATEGKPLPQDIYGGDHREDQPWHKG